MKPIIVANWTMNPQTLAEAKALFNVIKKSASGAKDLEIVICPPFPFITNFQSQILNLKLGAQDCFWEEAGAFTGEVSPVMLKNLGCEYVILGHSERILAGETRKMVNKKIKAVLASKLKVILCVGETKEQRGEELANKVIKEELKQSLRGVDFKFSSQLIIAYEPIWAIGEKDSCDIATAIQARGQIKKFLAKIFKRSLAEKIKIIYGGSVTGANARDFVSVAGFKGILVGTASLDNEEFTKIIKNFG